MEIGDKIELTEGQQAVVRPQLDKIDRARAAFSESMSLMLGAEKRLWETVREMRPDLAKWELQFDSGGKFMRLVSNRRDA